MRIPVHSPWLPGYIDVQTVLVILTMVQLFLDRAHICHGVNSKEIAGKSQNTWSLNNTILNKTCVNKKPHDK